MKHIFISEAMFKHKLFDFITYYYILYQFIKYWVYNKISYEKHRSGKQQNDNTAKWEGTITNP